MSDFTYWGDPFDYETGEYNDARLNERAVEVPIAQRFAAQPGVGLELGNVLSHYGPVSHAVVDRHEQGDGVSNFDVFDIGGRFDWIVAVSTVEHVRWDEEPKTDRGSADAIEYLRQLLNPGGRLLVTVPFGWHPFLDSQILAGEFEPDRECSFIRDGDGWVQTEVQHRRYAETTIWAESIWVAEFSA